VFEDLVGGELMTYLDFLMNDLVVANRILAREEVVDGLGHISVRHPHQPDRFFMSRARAPECIELEDLMEFTLDGSPISPEGRKPYNERYIHAAIYAARPDVRSVVHSHSHAVIPFGVTGERLRPVHHICSAIGSCVPVYDPHQLWGDTDILVTDMIKARALAEKLGGGTTALLRGHGSVTAGQSIRHAVFLAIHLEMNALLQLDCLKLGKPVQYLSDGEIELISRWMTDEKLGEGLDRMWERWCKRADVAFVPRQIAPDKSE
jgi:ribulose-5-phosphate 4-epimerase/fuculose-1-phosphate aldolase